MKNCLKFAAFALVLIGAQAPLFARPISTPDVGSTAPLMFLAASGLMLARNMFRGK